MITKSKQLTPDYIQQIINEEEIPLRSNSFGPEITQLAFRYGGVVGSVIEQQSQISRGADYARQLILAAEEKNVKVLSPVNLTKKFWPTF